MDKQKAVDLIDTNATQIETLIRQKIQIWSEYTLFSNLWWFGVFLSIIPWVVWYFFRPKESTDRLLYAGVNARLE